MTNSDPMGPHAGKVLLNGNAETPARFVELAMKGMGPPKHRDPMIQRRGAACVITASWGKGEAGDAPLHRHLKSHGVGESHNLGLYGAFRLFLRERPVVRALYDEHDAGWHQLVGAYEEENDAMVARLRGAWESARDHLGTPSMVRLLTRKGRAPGPKARPVRQLVEAAAATRVQRTLASLVAADERHAQDLRRLWDHFHLAAGLEYDPLWVQQRNELSDAILGSTSVLLTGGDPAVLLLSLRFFDLGKVMMEALRRGTSFFGSSAGAMVLGRRVVVFHDRRNPRQEFQMYERGLGLFQGIQVLPHVKDRVQTENEHNLAYLASRFSTRLCVGLNAGSTLALGPGSDGWQASSVGEEDVVVFGVGGEKRRYKPGEQVLL